MDADADADAEDFMCWWEVGRKRLVVYRCSLLGECL